MRRILRSLVIGAIAATLAAPPARAAQLPSTPVPQNPLGVTHLGLQGADPGGVVVQVDDPYGGGGHFWSAPPGGDPIDLGAEARSATSLGVAAGQFAWSSPGPGGWVLHRADLATGTDHPIPTDGPAVAWVGDAYLTQPTAGSLVRHPLAGAAQTLYTGRKRTFPLAADAAGVVLVDSDGAEPFHERVQLLTYGSSTVETLSDDRTTVRQAALSPTTVAWTRQVANSPAVQVQQRRRAGGDVSSFTDPDPYAGQNQLAAGDGRVAYPTADPEAPGIRVVTGSSATLAPVPAPAVYAQLTRIAATPGGFVTAVSGPAGVAGAWRTDDGTTARRVATFPAPDARADAVAFSAGRLWYGDLSGPVEGEEVTPRVVSRRTVTGERAPVLGPRSVAPEPAVPQELWAGLAISASAGRSSWAVPGGRGVRFRLFDRDRVTGSVNLPSPPTSGGGQVVTSYRSDTSGPYTAIAGSVYRPDGTAVWRRPARDHSGVIEDDVFGSRIVYTSDLGTVLVRDVEKPTTATNPAVIQKGFPRGAQPRVAIWGRTVAWVQGRDIRLRTLGRTGTWTGSRTQRTGGDVQQLVLGEGTLAWVAATPTQDGTGARKARALDLTDPRSVPLVIGDGEGTLALDGHHLARPRTDGDPLTVYRLPFDHPQPARFLGSSAPRALTPDGDGRADIWNPQFDASKPLAGVVLQVLGRTGRVLRTLHGTGPDGSVRDIVWDGRTGSGATVPDGTYGWRLTASAADGEGRLVAGDGSASLTGSVRVGGMR